MKNKKIIIFLCFLLYVFISNSFAENKKNLDKSIFHFEVSSSELTIEEQDTIKRMAQKVACLNLKVLIESNTDITGKEETNVILSQKRADIVRDYFISLGVSKDDIQVISYVATNPIDSNPTPEAYSKNRRTEITLIDPKKEEFPRVIK